MVAARPQAFRHRSDEFRDRRSTVAFPVCDAEAAAQIQPANGMTGSAQIGRQPQDLIHGFIDRRGIENLRTNMATHAFRLQVAKLPRALIHRGRIG